ncbi:MAG: 3-phosphoshikimate 1-carboxyvinyltransferase, partial [Oscillospiraceae bacterium]|nr:3-phosphoshikimate 1-carboxyvinyltransferase [Oscillospiraceae bacterium]
ELTSPLQSSAYVDITVDVMKNFGVTVEKTDSGFRVSGDNYTAVSGTAVEADWSQAAFFLAANALGRDVKCEGLNSNSAQGDKAIASIVAEAVTNGRIKPMEIDVSEFPDLVPPLAAMFCFADGVSKLTNAGRLRLKESDRLESVADAVNKLGGNAQIDGDTLIITGVSTLRGGAVNPRGDHRIAMMTAVLSLRCDGEVWLTNPECVNKSYPNFWKDFEVIPR